ncbi:Uncharacterized protein Adt_11524 [Abeliophyllum distichum]|uniref:Retrotransposon gag domain-containing protein n=1 Tax=Abeliophyllum distichum TaxID=126358 RepID=A0ABD1UN41_9LAMI
MSLSEYIMKFEELSRFPDHVVSTNGLKIDYFLQGLKSELNIDVLMSGIQNMTFPEITNKTLLSKQPELDITQTREASRQNQNGHSINKNWNQNKRGWPNRQQGESSPQKIEDRC